VHRFVLKEWDIGCVDRRVLEWSMVVFKEWCIGCSDGRVLEWYIGCVEGRGDYGQRSCGRLC
jgi:hypothetical protein